MSRPRLTLPTALGWVFVVSVLVYFGGLFFLYAPDSFQTVVEVLGVAR